MSIINDALKKASAFAKASADSPPKPWRRRASQEKVAGPEAAEESIVEPRKYISKPAVEPEVAKKAPNKRLIILWSILSLVGCGLFLTIFGIRGQTFKGKLEQIIPSITISEQTSFLPSQEAKDAVIKEAIISVPKVPSLHLTGIIWGLGEPFAFINGKIVEEGDTVGGAKVLEIRQKEVRLNFGGEDLLLTLKR